MPYGIYIRDRDAALEQGDPCLALVYGASNQAAALKAAADNGVQHQTGLLATWFKQHEIPAQTEKVITFEDAD